MATERTLKELVINKVESLEVFRYMQANGLINEDELYLVGGNEDIDDNSGTSTAEPAVLYTAQELTEEQKAQARANIGAVSIEYMNIASEEEFLDWLIEAQVITPVTSDSGEIYISSKNEIYVL